MVVFGVALSGLAWEIKAVLFLVILGLIIAAFWVAFGMLKEEEKSRKKKKGK